MKIGSAELCRLVVDAAIMHSTRTRSVNYQDLNRLVCEELEPITSRVQGNRRADAIPSKEDEKLILMGALRRALEILEAEE